MEGLFPGLGLRVVLRGFVGFLLAARGICSGFPSQFCRAPVREPPRATQRLHDPLIKA